ncbi:hypothetical protein [Deinococcus sp. YIM 77859]|uniref:hypothetical protein n=1 Tax=Deinococcus sp. YIM 77859 TaxID=1540221 RepID=UPI000553529B|nr:hypothetical protein [Deinococcus sp. YIM 77859]
MASELETFLRLLPLAFLLGFGGAGVLAAREARQTGSPAAVWRAGTWLALAAACVPLVTAALLRGSETVNADVLLALLALSALLYLPAARRTLRERGGEPTAGLLLWPLAFLLLVLPWIGVILGYVLG